MTQTATHLSVVSAPAEDAAYRQLVREGIDQAKVDGHGEWRWGDLINKLTELSTVAAVDGIYHTGAKVRIEQYIKDTSCPASFATLKERAQVAKVFPMGKRIATFQAHKVLQGATVQHLLTPGMGYADAMKALAKFRTPNPASTKVSNEDQGFQSDVEAEQADWDAEGADDGTPVFSEAPCQVQPWDPNQGFLRKFNVNLKLQMKPAVLRNQSTETLRIILEHVQETRALLDKYEAAVRRAEKKSNAQH